MKSLGFGRCAVAKKNLYQLLLDSIYGPDHIWVEQWNAYPFVHPGAKLRTARLVTSHERGTGKTSESYALCRAYGVGRTNTDLRPSQLVSPINTWIVDKVLTVVQECRRVRMDDIKTLITEPYIDVRARYGDPPKSVRNQSNFIFQSNYPSDALIIDLEERRFHVWEMTGVGYMKEGPLWTEYKKKTGKDFWTEFYAWIDSEDGASELREYLENVNLDGFDPFGSAPMTVSKIEMNETTASPLENWCRKLKVEPKFALGGEYKLATTSDLVAKARYDLSDYKNIHVFSMRAALKAAGIKRALMGEQVSLDGTPDARRYKQIKFEGENHTFWLLTAEDGPMTAAEIRRQYRRITWIVK